jgi:hypothetical protein
VSDLSFSQPARRNLLAPVLIAFLILGIALALVLRYTPHRIADITITHTSVFPAHTTYAGNTIMVGRNQSQDDLYVVAQVRIDDRLNLPLFLKDFTGAMTTAEGEQIAGTAAEKQDLETIYSTFPAIRPMASEPLLRETLISPGGSAQGMVLLHFPVSQSVWDHRRSAKLNIALYHQGEISVSIPRGNEVSRASDSTNNDD